MNEPLFSGFIEFEDKYDAEDAVKDLDDKRLCGERVKLEMSKVISCYSTHYDKCVKIKIDYDC